MDLPNYIQLIWPLAFGLTYMLHSTVWILLVAALVQIPLFQHVQIRHYLWKVALLGGLFTSTLVQLNKTDLLVIPLINTSISTENNQVLLKVEIPSLLEASNFPLVQIPVQAQLNKEEKVEQSIYVDESKQTASTPKTEQIVANPTTQTEHHFLFFYIGYFLLFWLIGSLFIFLKLSIQHWLYFKNIGIRLPVKQAKIVELFQNLQKKGKISKDLLLTQSTTLTSPILIRSKEICLPTKAIKELELIHIQAILAHELGHVARKDYYWTCGITLLETLFFFQPLHQLAKKHLHSTTEILCDHWATKLTGDNLALAKCLVKVASWIKRSNTRPVLVAGMSLKKSELSHRIHSLINLPDMKKQRFSRLKMGLSFTGLLLFTLLMLPGFTITSFDDTITTVSIQQSVKESDKPEFKEIKTSLLNTDVVKNTSTKQQKRINLAAQKIPTVKPLDITEPSNTLNPITPVPEVVSLDLLPKKSTIEVSPNNKTEDNKANHLNTSLNTSPKSKPIVQGRFPTCVKQSWVTRNNGQRDTEFGLELKKEVSIKIEIRNADNDDVVKTILDKKLEKGIHNFEWKHKNTPAGDYYIVYTIQGLKIKERISVAGPLGKLIGRFGAWRAKLAIKKLEKNIPFSGSLSPVKGQLPAVVKQHWVEQSHNRTETPIGIELREAATVHIEVQTKLGNTVASVVNKQLEQGMHHFEWPHKNIKKGTYLLSTTVNGQTISQQIKVYKVRQVNNKEKYTCAELLRAVKDDDLEKVKRLVVKVDPNCTYRGDGEPRAALNAAARKGNVAIGKVLLAANADVSYKANGDEGALMGAARYGRLDFVKLLVENGADINKVVRGDGTALINSVKRGHYEVTEYLLQNGADITLSVQGDESPLHHATVQGDKMLDLLLKYR